MKTIYRKVRLGDGRIKKAKITGDVGADVWDIQVRHRGKYVNPHKLKGKKFPIVALNKTPFIDMNYVESRRKKKTKKKTKKRK